MSIRDIAKTILNAEIERSVLPGEGIPGQKDTIKIRYFLKENLPEHLQQQLEISTKQLETSVPRSEHEKTTDRLEKLFTPIKEEVEERIKNIQNLLDILPLLNEILAKAELDRPIDGEVAQKSAATLGFMIKENQKIEVDLANQTPAKTAAAFAVPKSELKDLDDLPRVLDELNKGQYQEATTLKDFDEANAVLDYLRHQTGLRANFWIKLQGDLINLANEAYKERKKT